MTYRLAKQTRIRTATADDAAVIADIYNESVHAGDASMDDELKDAGCYLNLMASFDKRETILILENTDTILGWGIIKKYSDRTGYRFCCETAVYLRRNLVRNGYGTKIKLALIERCRQMGYHHLLARIFASNESSIKYNQKLGYQIVGRQQEIGYKNGRWQDVVIMQLVLAEVPPEIPDRYR